MLNPIIEPADRWISQNRKQMTDNEKTKSVDPIGFRFGINNQKKFENHVCQAGRKSEFG